MAAYVKAILSHQRGESATTGRAAALCKQLVDLGPLPQSLSIDTRFRHAVLVITGTGNIKGATDHFGRLVLTQLIYQRVRSSSSDIKRAVAFFSIAFSRSRRLMRASSS